MKWLWTLIVLLLLSCGGSKTSQTIQFWHFWTDPRARPVIESIVADFEAENPGWDVQVTDLTWTDGHQKIVVAFGAGNPPDLLELGSDWIAEFAASNALREIDVDTSRFVLVDPGTYDGRLYALPWFLDSRVLYFNKPLLNRAGMGVPDNWEHLLEACRKIDLLSDEISGFGANSAEPHRLYKKFLPFVWSLGGDIVKDGEIKLDDPAVVTALKYYGELARCGRIETQQHLEDAFVAGEIGFVISGGWLNKRLKENPPDFEYALALMLPEREGMDSWSFAGGEYLVIPENSKRKDAARKLMEVTLRPRNIQALVDSVGFGFPPYRDEPPGLESREDSILFAQLMHSRSTPVHPRWVYIERIIENMVEQVTLGSLMARDAARAAQQEMERVAKD